MSELHIYQCDKCPRFEHATNRPEGWSHVYFANDGPFDLCRSCTAEVIKARQKLDHTGKPKQ